MIFLKVFKSLCLAGLLLAPNANAGVDFSTLSGKSSVNTIVNNFIEAIEAGESGIECEHQLRKYCDKHPGEEIKIIEDKIYQRMVIINALLNRNHKEVAAKEMDKLKSELPKGSVFYAGSWPLTEEELNVRELSR